MLAVLAVLAADNNVAYSSVIVCTLNNCVVSETQDINETRIYCQIILFVVVLIIGATVCL